MCDYSLEMYRSKPAVQGEEYVTRRFASGSIGFVSAGEPDVAVCMACDTRLVLADVPAILTDSVAERAASEVVFVRLEQGPYHDGVQFANGARVTLQQLGPGVRAKLVDALSGKVEFETTPAPERRAKVFEPA